MSAATTGRRRILVITHEASRTGAPRVAQLVTRALVRDGHHVSVVSRRDGPLVAELATITTTRVEPLSRVRHRLVRGRRGAALRLAALVDACCAWATLTRARPDLVYVNSSAAAAYVRAARWRPRRRTVLHVHESAPLVRGFLDAAGVRDLPAAVELVACSPSVHAGLEELTAHRRDVRLVVSVPDDGQVLDLAGGETPEDGPIDGLVVGCCGTVEHRKGVDLWVRAAEQVLADLPGVPVRFVWVGAGEPPAGPRDPRIRFVGSRANPYPLMARFDVATLPSRDDPFPLVVLESMLLGTPVVAFDVGGVAAQVGDTGIVVGAERTDQLAEAVGRLLVDDALRERLGAAAGRRARDTFATRDFERSVRDLVAG